MLTFRFLTFIFIISFWNNTQAQSPYYEVAQAADNINECRRFNHSAFPESEQKITDILAGNRYRINPSKHATDEERHFAWTGVLTLHLNAKRKVSTRDQRSDHLRELCAASVQRNIEPNCYAHAFALITMHIAAHALVWSSGSYFWDQPILHKNVQTLFFEEVVNHPSLNTLHMNWDYKEYLRQQTISSSYMQAVIGEPFQQTLILLTQEYADIPEQRVIQAYETFCQENKTPFWMHLLQETGYFTIGVKTDIVPQAIIIDCARFNIKINTYFDRKDVARVHEGIFIVLKPQQKSEIVMRNLLNELNKQLNGLEGVPLRISKKASLKAVSKAVPLPPTPKLARRASVPIHISPQEPQQQLPQEGLTYSREFAEQLHARLQRLAAKK